MAYIVMFWVGVIGYHIYGYGSLFVTVPVAIFVGFLLAESDMRKENR